MVELLATFGATAKELFEYNRDYYTFDQKQRLDREMLRLEMQIKRFDLFREDIRDLVELTCSKMEMYHLVGALVLEFCVLIYTEGAELAWVSKAPPFMKACWGMSLASAFTYIILAVWLSMHASVSAQSFGTRLLTRFVRLPIPGAQQINALNARLTDFERQGVGRMLRVPWTADAQQWEQIRQTASASDPADQRDEGDNRFKPAVRVDNELRAQDLLGAGEVGIQEEDLCNAATRLPGHHVQLFRRLQAKWQCYDTYARVCMSLGAYHILASISYYLIIVTMKHYWSMTTGYATITVFMVTLSVLGALDAGRGMLRAILALQIFGAIPVYLAAAIMSSTMWADLQEQHTYPYPYSPLIFFLVALWHEGLLHMCWPSDDGMSLPRRFRTVLFIDVFAVADEALRQQIEEEKEANRQAGAAVVNVPYSEEQVLRVEEALFAAESALRRWQAVPPGTSEATLQSDAIDRLRTRLLVSRKMMNGEAARISIMRGDKEALALLQVDTRGWNDLTPEEQREDPYSGTLLGPFQNAEGHSYYYDVEAREFVWHAEGREVVDLDMLADLVATADKDVKGLLVGRPDEGGGDEEEEDSFDAAPAPTPAPGRGPSVRSVARNDDGVEVHYREQRLPWKAMRGMTHVLEFVWFLQGLWFAVEQIFPEHRTDRFVSVEERRLGTSAPGSWSFEDLGVEFPTGAFFRPSALSCLADESGHLLVGTADGLYRAATGAWLATTAAVGGGRGSEPRRRLEALPPSTYPAGTVALCSAPARPRPLSSAAASVAVGTPTTDAGAVAATAADSARRPQQRCLLGQATAQGIALWPLDADRQGLRTVVLPVEGRAWSQLAGAIVHCRDVAGLLAALDGAEAGDKEDGDAAGAAGGDGAAGFGARANSSSSSSEVEWCLLLIGWDGSRLPVAAVPLPRGPREPPSASATVSPAFDAPLSPKRRAEAGAAGDAAVVAMALEPRRGRLWAALAGGGVQAWELLGDAPKSLGRWTLPSSRRIGRRQEGASSAEGGSSSAASEGGRAVAVCEDSARSQLLVAVTHSAPGGAPPRLLRARLGA